jgi:hypothetical protein
VVVARRRAAFRDRNRRADCAPPLITDVRRRVPELNVDAILGTFVSTFFGALVGALVTWVVARYYYRQAAKDLAEEAAKFRQILDGTVESFEQSGWVRLNRDVQGRITRMTPTLGLGVRPPAIDADRQP